MGYLVPNGLKKTTTTTKKIPKKRCYPRSLKMTKKWQHTMLQITLNEIHSHIYPYFYFLLHKRKAHHSVFFILKIRIPFVSHVIS